MKTKCVPCEGGVPALSEAEVAQHLKNLSEWCLSDCKKYIYKKYLFKGYYKVMAFVNAIAWIAHQEQHHPDLEVSYNTCLVKFSTHSIDGISENDIIMAQKVSDLIEA